MAARPAGSGLLPLAALLLVLTYAGYSALSIAHQAWGAMLGGDERQRSRVVGWREGFGLVGVVLASVLPLTAGLAAMVGLFALALAGRAVGAGPAPRGRWPRRPARRRRCCGP